MPEGEKLEEPVDEKPDSPTVGPSAELDVVGPTATCPDGSATCHAALALSIGDGSEAVGSGTLKVYRVEGREAISEPFRFAIDLLRVGADNTHLALTSDDVLGKRATLRIAVADGGSKMVRRIHGVIEEFMVDERSASTNDAAGTVSHYRVVLAPRLSMLARNRQNRIHATWAPRTLEELIRDKLLSRGADYTAQERNGRVVLEADEFRIDIDNEKVPLQGLSHVAQYNETDLDFIRRLCECHGVYFLFGANADDTGGVVVFGNTNTAFGVVRFEADTAPGASGAGSGPRFGDDPDSSGECHAGHRLDIDLRMTGSTGLVGGSTYRQPDAGPAKLDGALYSFTSVHRPAPGRVHVIDDQAAGNDVDLKRTVTLDADERGVYTDYDTHFSTQAAGDAFARVRSQELRCASRYSIGLTNTPCVAPGRTFRKVPDGDSSTAARKFLVTEATIEVKQAHAGVITEIDGEVIATGFSNRFRCIEFDPGTDCAFCPPRVTPIPRLPGVQTAYVATGRNDRPVLDDDGAYRIYQKFVDERAELDVDRRSKAVRKAEPYAGDGVGMHFPLKRDTEVLVAYRNGDPDRPVIAGAVPGVADQSSPVTGVNQTSHVVETSSGSRFEIHDGDDDARSRVALRSREGSEHASYLRLGKAHTTDSGAVGSSGEGKAGGRGSEATLEDHYAEEVFLREREKQDGIALYTADNIREATKKDKITEARGAVHVHAGGDIYTRSVAKHLLSGKRMVIFAGTAEHEPDDATNTRDEENEERLKDDSMFLLSSGNMYLKAHGDIHEAASGSVIEEAGGDLIKRIDRNSYTYIRANSHRDVRGSSNNLVLGANTSFTVGFSTAGHVAGVLEIAGPLIGLVGAGFMSLVRHSARWNYYIVYATTNDVVKYTDVASSYKRSWITVKNALVYARSAVMEAGIDNLVVTTAGVIAHV